MTTSSDKIAHSGNSDTVVIGGGLAGLTAAVLLGRAGHRVTLYEKARAVGGRAQTQAHGDFRLNIGPHALYRAGDAKRILGTMGLRFKGGVPRVTGGFAIARGAKHALPGGFVSLLTTSLLRLPDKLELARLMSALPKIDASAALGLTFGEWVERNIRRDAVRDLIKALSRVATYANAPQLMCAGMTLRQMQLAFTQSVDYLDGGWQTMVDALRDAALAAGVHIATGERVIAVDHDGRVRGVRRTDGSVQPASAVIIAGAPQDAAELVPGSAALRNWADSAVPVKAACLDLALASLPQPNATFALGIDEPLYLSVHSAVAKLAAPGAALIHVAKYLDPTARHEPKQDEATLERALDLIQPGWRSVVVERRFLPSMTVCNALVSAASGGMKGRPSPAVPEITGLLIAGDWVGPHGLLADASVASAQAAADLAMSRDRQAAAA